MYPMHSKTAYGSVHQTDLQSTKRSLLVVLSCAVLLAFSFLYDDAASPLHRDLSKNRLKSHTSKHQTVDDGDNSRPVMYTFYSETSHTGKYRLTRDMNIDPLIQWEQAWQDAGWETRILTLEDAMYHPDFEYYSNTLSAIPNSKKGSYDFMCFVRWLAMAATKQDGFMSDYDTFPLGGIKVDFGHHLPNDGKFTSYQRHVPALLSGTASEWDRVAKRVLDIAVEHSHDRFYSDMFALRDLYYEDTLSYIQESRLAAYPYSKKNVVNCDVARTSLGAHLSHSQTDHNARAGLVPTGTGTSRGRNGLLLMDQVQEQCYNSSSTEDARDSDNTTTPEVTKEIVAEKIPKEAA